MPRAWSVPGTDGGSGPNGAGEHFVQVYRGAYGGVGNPAQQGLETVFLRDVRDRLFLFRGRRLGVEGAAVDHAEETVEVLPQGGGIGQFPGGVGVEQSPSPPRKLPMAQMFSAS